MKNFTAFCVLILPIIQTSREVLLFILFVRWGTVTQEICSRTGICIQVSRASSDTLTAKTSFYSSPVLKLW